MLLNLLSWPYRWEPSCSLETRSGERTPNRALTFKGLGFTTLEWQKQK